MLRKEKSYPNHFDVSACHFSDYLRQCSLLSASFVSRFGGTCQAVGLLTGLSASFVGLSASFTMVFGIPPSLFYALVASDLTLQWVVCLLLPAEARTLVSVGKTSSCTVHKYN